MALIEVVPVAVARAKISDYAKQVTADPTRAFYYGPHRKAQAVISNAARYQELLDIEQRYERQRGIEAAVASARLEGADPSPEFFTEAQSYVDGTATIEELIDRAKVRLSGK